MYIYIHMHIHVCVYKSMYAHTRAPASSLNLSPKWRAKFLPALLTLNNSVVMYVRYW